MANICENDDDFYSLTRIFKWTAPYLCSCKLTREPTIYSQLIFVLVAFYFSRISVCVRCIHPTVMKLNIYHVAALFLMWIIHSIRLAILWYETRIYCGIHQSVSLMVWCFRTWIFGVSWFLLISCFIQAWSVCLYFCVLSLYVLPTSLLHLS